LFSKCLIGKSFQLLKRSYSSALRSVFGKSNERIVQPMIMHPKVKNGGAQPAWRRYGKVKFPKTEPILPDINAKERAEALKYVGNKSTVIVKIISIHTHDAIK
jgi:hypothetical protein